MLCLCQKFQKLPSEEMDFKSTVSVTANSIFFSQLALQLFDLSQKETPWLLESAELKYICMYIYSDRAQHFWKPGRLPYTSEKNWRTTENVIISVCPFREQMLYSYSNELNTTVWAITVEQQAQKAAPTSGKYKQPDISAEVQPECWIRSKAQRSICSFNHFSHWLCAGWWNCEIQLTRHFADMRYLNNIKNSISEFIYKTGFLGWGRNRHHTETQANTQHKIWFGLIHEGSALLNCPFQSKTRETGEARANSGTILITEEENTAAGMLAMTTTTSLLGQNTVLKMKWDEIVT